MRNKLTTREQLETRLDAQAQFMAAIVYNIRNRLPWQEWSEHDRAVFIASLAPMGKNAREEQKARDLFRHIFRMPVIEISRDVLEHEDLADRLRADIIGLVRLGSGRYFYEDFLQTLRALV
ncbi:hypothetical protein [Mesorhizobium sp. SP-1A]|uniref:hypothetical protein n=1 Tax=Mesorhizobium sp. SP-1A TaxID=3077840 RepID=UPI0028F74BDC|nr:hypothetical protein [Mesorhizobium sp. SP-1A]